MSPGFARWILNRFGWKVEGGIAPEIRKYVVIAAPHTSWWDFPLGILVRSAVGRRIHFLGKKSLFKPPQGWLMKALGGYPVDRAKNTRIVDQVVELFQTHEEFAIALAPEGTRKKVETFRTGFYFIAKGAGVPVICAVLDYGRHVVTFLPPFFPTGNVESDLHHLWTRFEGVRGKREGQGIGA